MLINIYLRLFPQDILAGKYDHLPEGAFYMVSNQAFFFNFSHGILFQVGNVDEVVAKGERLTAEAAAN